MSDSKPPTDSTPTPNLPRGLIGRRGTPAGKGTRLPSIRTPRDLTLGGIPKKTFTPNIPARREKKEEAKSDGTPKEKSQRGRGHDRGKRERGRGRGRGKPETIQSHSIFEEGPTAKTAKPTAVDIGYARAEGGGGRGGGGGRKASHAAGGIKRERDSEALDALLRDDFVDLGESMLDGSLVPVKLPLSVSCDIKQESQPIKEEEDKPDISKIKLEPSDQVDLIETEHKKIGPSPMVHAIKAEAVSPADLFTKAQKSERGELVFVQLPDALPGVPASFGSEEKDGDKNKDSDSEKSGFSLSNFSEGYVGKLQIHKSGKTKLVLGNVALDVSVGTPCSFLQDLVSVRIQDGSKEGDMTVLGHVKQRVICTPDFETLLHLSSDGDR